MVYSICIVEDHPIVREGYVALINREADMEICGEAGTGLEALERLPPLKPDLAIIDLSIPEMNGIDLIKQLRAQGEEFPILVMSAHNEALYAERVLRAGAQGYMMKDEASATVIEAIRTVLDGQIFLSEEIRTRFALQYVGQAAPASPLEQLSDRELEVFQHIGMGRSTRETAEAMIISPKTVETYRANIKQKLGIDSTTELMQRAVLWVEGVKE